MYYFVCRLAAFLEFSLWDFSVDLRQFMDATPEQAESVRLATLACWTEDMALSGVRASTEMADCLVLYAA